MDDLWGNLSLETVAVEESNAINTLREQARLLEKKTGGKVKATFSKIEYKTISVEGIGKALLSITGRQEEIVDLNDKKDFNEKLKYVKYKFEIYNLNYKFRVFILNYRSVFPLEIEVDEGIRDELNMLPLEIINSDEELKEKVSSVFRSKKLQMIMNKLYSMK